MRARQLFATALLVISTAPALAQQWDERDRQERFQRYQDLQSSCGDGDTQACIELGRMQERFAGRLRQDCQQGVQQSCVMLGRVEERRRQERQGQEQDVTPYRNTPMAPIPLQPPGQFQQRFRGFIPQGSSLCRMADVKTEINNLL